MIRGREIQEKVHAAAELQRMLAEFAQRADTESAGCASASSARCRGICRALIFRRQNESEGRRRYFRLS